MELGNTDRVRVWCPRCRRTHTVERVELEGSIIDLDEGDYEGVGVKRIVRRPLWDCRGLWADLRRLLIDNMNKTHIIVPGLGAMARKPTR